MKNLINTKNALKLLKVAIIALFALYLVGLAHGVDFKTWIDLAMGADLAALAVLVGVNEE